MLRPLLPLDTFSFTLRVIDDSRQTLIVFFALCQLLMRLGNFFFIDTYSVSKPEPFHYLSKNTSTRTWRVIFKFFQLFNPSSRNIPY